MNLKFKRINGVVYAGIKPHRGRRKWVSMATSDMTVAKSKARDAKLFKMQAVESVNALTNAVFAKLKDTDTVTVGQALTDYIESLRLKGRAASTVAQHLNTISSWLRIDRNQAVPTAISLVHDVKAEHFKPFFNPGDGTKLATLRIRQSVCVSFCDYCIDRGWMHLNAARGCGIDVSVLGQSERTTKSYPPVTNDEFAKLMQYTAGDRFWNLAILLSWETGLRLSDICLLEKISIIDNHLHLFTRKTNAFVRLPLVPSMVDAVNAVDPAISEAETKYLFPKERAEYMLYGAAPFSERFTRLARKAGVKDKSFHGLRTSFIQRTYVEKSEGILKKLSQELAKKETAALAGHSSTETTDIYLNATCPVPAIEGR